MIRAVVFDFDGVILESVGIKADAFRELFSNQPEHVDEIVAIHLDNPGVSRYEKFAIIYRDLLGQPLDQDQVDNLDKQLSEIIYRKILDCPFVDGAREFLELASTRCALFVASATPQAEVRDIVRRRGLASFFVGVYGSPTTKTEILAAILASEGLERQDVVFVGDAESDYRAAAQTGIGFVGRAQPGSPNPFSGPALAVVASLRELSVRWSAIEELAAAS